MEIIYKEIIDKIINIKIDKGENLYEIRCYFRYSWSIK